MSDKISKSLHDNKKYLQETLGRSSDIDIRHFIIPALNSREAMVVYIDGLADKDTVNGTIVRPLMVLCSFPPQRGHLLNHDPIDFLMDSGVWTQMIVKQKEWNTILDNLLTGDTILFVDGADSVIVHSTRGWDSRAVAEPATESEVRGPRDGFVETIRSNTALIRRRIRDFGLRFDRMIVGERTKTDVVLAYVDSLVDEKILDELKLRISRIKIDGILESGYIEEFIQDSPYAIFPQIERTERPDKACAAILEGRIVILVDNTPFTLIVPTIFWQYIQAAGDYYEWFPFATFLRFLRIGALFVSLTATSLYVVFTSFHQEMLPTTLALRAAGGREGVPFPSIIEALLMETTFEVMREAGIRMPRPVGSAVSIVGALVLGEAAVNAGLAAPLLVVIVAAAGISSFAIPAYNMSVGMRLLRFPLIILSGVFGILGFLTGLIVLSLHLLSLRSFGAPFMAPFSPWRKNANKDTLIRAPWWKMKRRPDTSNTKNPRRQVDEDLMPKPPQESE